MPERTAVCSPCSPAMLLLFTPTPPIPLRGVRAASLPSRLFSQRLRFLTRPRRAPSSAQELSTATATKTLSRRIALPFAIKGLAAGAFFGSQTPSLIGLSADGRMLQIARPQSSAANEQTSAAVEDWQTRALDIAASSQATAIASASISNAPGA